MLWKLAEVKVSVPLIMDLTGVIGRETRRALAATGQPTCRQTLAATICGASNLVAVSVDGGRIMTRVEAGRGVHDQKWKETKNACLLTMSSVTSADDPHPELPHCFSDRDHVEKLVREIHSSATGSTQRAEKTPEISDEPPVAGASAPPPPSKSDAAKSPRRPSWRPQRLMRTCLSSMASSDNFGPLVAGAAQRRGFYQAAPVGRFSAMARRGTGRCTKRTSPSSSRSPILCTRSVTSTTRLEFLAPDDPWSVYLVAATACWQGRVGDVLNDLDAWQTSHPAPPQEKLPDDDPRRSCRASAPICETINHV